MFSQHFHSARSNPQPFIIGFFIALFCIGALAFPAYGVSWDEPNQFRVSEKAYQYVFHGEPWPTIVGERFYGTVFELPAAVVGHLLELNDGRSILLLRHFLTFVYFFIGTIFFYLLCKRLFSSTWMGLLGAVVLVLSPRIFADAFYNSKDLPNLSVFIIAMYTLVRFSDEENSKWMAIHAFASALAIGIRLTSFLVPAFTGFFLLLHVLHGIKSGRSEFGKRAGFFVCYLVLTILFTIGVWPFLWEQPVAHLQEAFTFMSTLGISTYYMGETIHKLPWHYLFVWVGVTTPLLYIGLFFCGLAAILTAAVKRPVDWFLTRIDHLLPLMWLLLPIISVHLTGAGIFDGWRHLYFVYPAVVIIALLGLQWLHHFIKKEMVLTSILAVHSLWIAGWMVANHPIQNAYFSIPAPWVQHNFELDYWGLSFRPAFEYVLAHDTSPVLKIWASSSPAYSTVAIMPADQQARIQFVDEKDATYLLNNYRLFGYKQDYPHPEIHSIMVGGVKVLGIYTQ